MLRCTPASDAVIAWAIIPSVSGQARGRLSRLTQYRPAGGSNQTVGILGNISKGRGFRPFGRIVMQWQECANRGHSETVQRSDRIGQRPGVLGRRQPGEWRVD